jgi:hypothetical protein
MSVHPTIEARLEELANEGGWRDERALLARVLLQTYRSGKPGIGLLADIEACLGLDDPLGDSMARPCAPSPSTEETA